MSDEKNGSVGSGGGDGAGGFGPKKPKATFGDVMLGIPSGRADERGGRDKDRRSSSPKPSGEAGGGRPQGGAPREDRRPRNDRGGGGGRGGGERQNQGPMVVVKRASGAVETRGPVSPAPAAASESAPGEDRKSTRLNSSHSGESRMPSSA